MGDLRVPIGLDISDADAAVGDVKDPKTFYAGAVPKKTGTIPTVALAAGSNSYPAGYHVGEANLTAVDTDLVAANIADGVTIFGVLGTLVAGGVETFERYHTVDLANQATYTPGDEGIFSITTEFEPGNMRVFVDGSLGFKVIYGNALSLDGVVGDGVNMQVKNGSGTAKNYIIMRHHMSTGTYVRTFADLANGASYTPADSGFFTFGSDAQSSLFFVEYQYPGTWYKHITYDIGSTGAEGNLLVIGDGTNLRVTNNFGDQREWILIRAELT